MLLLVLVLVRALSSVGRAAALVFVGAANANIMSPLIWEPGVPDYIVFREIDLIANLSDVLMLSSAVAIAASISFRSRPTCSRRARPDPHTPPCSSSWTPLPPRNRDRMVGRMGPPQPEGVETSNHRDIEADFNCSPSRFPGRCNRPRQVPRPSRPNTATALARDIRDNSTAHRLVLRAGAASTRGRHARRSPTALWLSLRSTRPIRARVSRRAAQRFARDHPERTHRFGRCAEPTPNPNPTVISGAALETGPVKTPRFRGLSSKRMMRLELTTFCMASRRSTN